MLSSSPTSFEALDHYRDSTELNRDYVELENPEQILYAGFIEEVMEVNNTLRNSDNIEESHLLQELGDVVWYGSEMMRVRDMKSEDIDASKIKLLPKDKLPTLDMAATHVLVAFVGADTREFNQPSSLADSLCELFLVINCIAEENDLTFDQVLEANVKKLKERSRSNSIVESVRSAQQAKNT